MRFGKIKKFVLFGGGELLIYFADLLIKKNYEYKVYVCDRHLNSAIHNGITLKDWFNRNGVSFIVTDDIGNESSLVDFVDEHTVGISFGASWIFRKKVIDLFGDRLLNLHGNTLPLFRGGGGYSWNIMMGYRAVGITLHLVDGSVDTGDIVKKVDLPMAHVKMLPKCYMDYMYDKAKRLLRGFLNDLAKDVNFKLKKQGGSKSYYWGRLNTDIHGFIDWGWDYNDIHKFICAFDEPYNGATTFINAMKVHFKDCAVSAIDEKFQFHPFQYGLVYRKLDGKLYIAANHGALIVGAVLLNKESIIKEVKLGDRFYTPHTFLDSAMATRVFYKSNGIINKK